MYLLGTSYLTRYCRNMEGGILMPKASTLYVPTSFVTYLLHLTCTSTTVHLPCASTDITKQ